MNTRNYYSMFKNEPDVLAVPDVIRLLRIGKNSVCKLIKDGVIGSIKQGKKIIVPKTCLVDYLTDETQYQIPLPNVTKRTRKLWTFEGLCATVVSARELKGKIQRKGA